MTPTIRCRHCRRAIPPGQRYHSDEHEGSICRDCRTPMDRRRLELEFAERNDRGQEWGCLELGDGR